ncbi:O-antigen ligase family protein [Candidatus Berkiella aquae]|uniref:O-antigen ligase family protein n=2 Tax=Candidatus Berkiella aquae TaxID=295108 RepID=A0AAE3HUX8_9GAMM|nr:O-antigen ligase family protein [Candidatus Berkiella aquae]MCS5710135.1 O-antigen ligase family protein [Candidatus Berkiella aquae]
MARIKKTYERLSNINMATNKSFLELSDPKWDKLGQASAIALAFVVPISTAITTILVVLCFLAWLLGPNHAQKKDILSSHPIVMWIYALILLALCGMFYSAGDEETMRRSLIDSLRLGVIPILMYFYQDKKIGRLALWAFACAMIFTMVLAFGKVYAGLPIGTKYPMGAVFKSHIKTSYFMAIAAFFLAFQCKYLPKYRWSLLIIVGFMIYYLLFMSVGRIGYITIVFSFLFLAWQWYRLKGILLATCVACAMLVGTYFTSPVFSQRVNLLVQDMDFYHQGGRLIESSLGSRLAFAKTSTALIMQEPLLGWGTGSYGAAYAQYHQGEATLLTDNPHNEYLRIAVESGIVGLLLLLGLFYRQWQLTSQMPLDIRGFCQGVLLTFMLGCMLNSWLKDFAEGYFFCLMTAICFAIIPLPSRKLTAKAVLLH